MPTEDEKWELIMQHPRVDARIKSEGRRAAKKSWGKSRLSLAHQHGFQDEDELREFLAAHGRPRRQLTSGQSDQAPEVSDA